MDIFWQWHRSFPHYHEVIAAVQYAIVWLLSHRP